MFRTLFVILFSDYTTLTISTNNLGELGILVNYTLKITLYEHYKISGQCNDHWRLHFEDETRCDTRWDSHSDKRIRLKNWFVLNGLQLNTSKSHIIHFPLTSMRSDLTIPDKNVSVSLSAKLQCLDVDSNFNYKFWVQSVAEKVSLA